MYALISGLFGGLILVILGYIFKFIKNQFLNKVYLKLPQKIKNLLIIIFVFVIHIALFILIPNPFNYYLIYFYLGYTLILIIIKSYIILYRKLKQ